MRKLTRWHLWWLRQFEKAGEDGIFTMGWEGTIQGRSLGNLVEDKLVGIDTSFEGGLSGLSITDKGREALSRL